MRTRRSGRAVLGAVALCALAAGILMLCLHPGQARTPQALRIACGDDAAGLLVSYAATQTDSVEAGAEEVAYLRLSDCCGTQAEFALGNGDFDMAVLCPDAAALFLASPSGEGYAIAGGIVRNANVLVQKPGKTVTSVGYMNGRQLQMQAVRAHLGEITFRPMMATALPYALERDAVDGVVLDVLSVISSGTTDLCVPLDYERPSGVLVVSNAARETAAYRSFLTAYNEAVALFNGDGFDALFPKLIKTENSEESIKRWRETGIRFIPMPNEG